MITALYRPEIWRHGGHGPYAERIAERSWLGPVFYTREAAQKALVTFLQDYSADAWGMIREMFMNVEE